MPLDDIPTYAKLGGVTTTAATPSTLAYENIKINLKGNYVRLHQLPEFNKKKENLPIALVGGGPTLNDHMEELRKFKTIVSCGSVHDWLLMNNIVPTYATVCDPDLVTLNYVQLKHQEVKYLIASACDPKVFEYLKDVPLVMWHCHSDDYITNGIKELDKEYQAIGGGCTVGLRSLSIALMLGYNNIHLFGFDSCLSTDDLSYAYNLSTEEEKKSQGQVYNLKIGMDWNGPGDKTYHCLGYHLAQAEHFKQLLSSSPNMFNPTFYGEGLLPDLVTMIRQEGLKVMPEACK